jgi:serine protease AprX
MNAAAELLWFNGIVVVTSVGNKGPAGGFNTSQTAPANDPFFIAVGASDEHNNTDRSDDTYAPFSSYGTTLDGHTKPDIVTPGYNIISALSASSTWGLEYPEKVVGDNYIRLSGTSMSAPIVSGGVAVLLQYMPELTPDQVKYLFTENSSAIKLDKRTGYPYLDVWGIVQAMRTWQDFPSANTGEMMNQLLFTGDPNAWDPSVAWNSVAWNSVAWNSVAWNSVAWNSVAWNSVAWNSVAWNSVELNGVFWGK